MTKLTHFAHPRGWGKGCPMRMTSSVGGAPAVVPADQPGDRPGDLLGHVLPGTIPYLAFTNDIHRAQWLKWWRKA